MESWTYLIHKNGSKTDPSDYRGITLLSSLGKLFTALVYNRIENEIKSKDIFSPSQADLAKVTEQLTLYLHFLVWLEVKESICTIVLFTFENPMTQYAGNACCAG